MLTVAQSLMVGVLEQAIADLESRSFNIRRQALAWFLARGARANHIFSFPQICQEFGYNPTIVRSRVLANGSQILYEARDEPHRASG